MIAADKLGHIKICAGIAFVLSLAFSPEFGFVAAMGVGIAKEIWDLCGHGTPEWGDLLADLVGAIIGCGGAICIKFIIQ